MTNIVRKRGDTCAIQREIKSKSTGAAIDISGYSFLLTVNSEKEPANSDNQIFQVSGTITSALSGLVDFFPSVSDASNVGDYFYDIQLTDAGGKKRTIESGRYRVSQDITKD